MEWSSSAKSVIRPQLNWSCVSLARQTKKREENPPKRARREDGCSADRTLHNLANWGQQKQTAGEPERKQQLVYKIEQTWSTISIYLSRVSSHQMKGNLKLRFLFAQCCSWGLSSEAGEYTIGSVVSVYSLIKMYVGLTQIKLQCHVHYSEESPTEPHSESLSLFLGLGDDK